MGKEIKLSDTAKLLISNHVLPHRKIFEYQGALDITVDLIKLLEEYGDCPSIVIDRKDPESVYLISVRNRLVNISLKEHSYGVVLNLVEAMKSEYVDYKDHMPKAVIAALSHDIGKIPDLRALVHDTHEHSIVSARKLREMFGGNSQYLAEKVISAVENHHSYLEDDFTQMLKRADRQARQGELLRLSQNSELAPLNVWFSIEEFYKRIEPYINFSKGSTKWKALSFKGFLYCRPKFISDIAKELCKESGIVDLTFLDESAHDDVIHKVISHFREHGLIPDQLGPHQSSRRYVIQTYIGMKHGILLTPLRPPPFYNMKEIENRKIGFLEIIRSVRPG